MASRTIATILSLRDNFSSTIRNTTNNTRNFQRQLQHTQNSARRMSQGINSAFKGVIFKAGALVAGFGLARFAKESIMLASDLNEVQNVVDTTFGKSANIINDFAKTAINKFGLSELQAKKFSGTIGSLASGMGISGKGLTGMSTNLTGLAADFASFYNLSPEEAFDKIKAGIIGSSEPLLSLGIDMRDGALAAYTLAKGTKKSWKEMSSAEKTQIRYNYLMEKGKLATGDFEKTNKGFANALRVAQVQIKQLGANIAAKALPHLNKLLNAFNVGFTKIPAMFDKVKTKAKELWDKFNIGPILANLKSNFLIVFEEIKTTIQNAKQPVMDFIETIVDLAKKIWTEIQPAIEWIKANVLPTVWDTVKTAIKGIYDIAKTAFDFISANWSLIAPLIEGIAIAFGIYKTAMLIGQGVILLVTAAQWAWNVAMMANPIGLIIVAVGLLIGIGILLYRNWDTVKVKMAMVWDGIKGMFVTGVNWCIDKINWMIEKINILPGINLPTIKQIGYRTSIDETKLSLSNQKSYDLGHNAIGTQYWKGGKSEVNERGGEIIDLPSGSRVIPADKSSKMMGGITIAKLADTIIVREDADIDKIANAIVRKLGSAALNLG